MDDYGLKYIIPGLVILSGAAVCYVGHWVAGLIICFVGAHIYPRPQ